MTPVTPEGAGVTGRYLVVGGPTGAGKSALALRLAVLLGGEIVSCDSVQVYRGFDLGAAKPSLAERALVPHHLLDVVAPDEAFDAAAYARAAGAKLADIASRGRLPVVVGGTGLYLRALLGQGWHADLPHDDALRQTLAAVPTPELYERLQRCDPERAGELHAHDRVRIARALELVTLLGSPLRAAGLTADAPRDARALILVLEPPRAELHRRIAERTAAMLAAGLVDEVRGLLAAGVSRAAKPMLSIGYKQVAAHLAGELPLAALPAQIETATRQYAKRQCTWFRKVDADLRLPAAHGPAAWLPPLAAELGRPAVAGCSEL